MRIYLYIFFVLTGILFVSCKTNDAGHKFIASAETTVDTLPGSCPYLTKDQENNIVLSWIRKTGDGYVFCYAVSTNQGANFSKPIVVPGSTNIHPHGENLPKIIFKPSGKIIAVWGASNPNPSNAYSGLIYFSQSADNGNSWTKARTITSDTTSYDQRYFDLALLPNGEAGIVWLDNRKNGTGEGSGLFYAETNGDTGFANERLITEPCCQCCRTDLFIDAKQNRHVLYRGIINDSIRDMVHIVSIDSGKSFSKPQRISTDNWVINGCPHTGPAMTENKNGLYFTWFTGGTNAGIYSNRSDDNGNSFTSRNLVAGKDAKHCQVTTVDTDSVIITWNENFSDGKEQGNRIGIASVNNGGLALNTTYITARGNNATFPVLQAISGKKLLIAYTVEKDKKEQVFYKQVAWQ